MSEEALWGPCVSTTDVEEAVIATLRVWYDEWLAVNERSRSLLRETLTRPPSPISFHGGDDFESWKQDLLPEIIVDVKTDSLERNSSAGYTVAYEVQIACLLERQDEEEARLHASLHGAALMFLVQQPDLGGLAERLVMSGKPPMPEFIDPSNRRLARTIATFTVWVSEVVNENLGPVQPNPQESPEYEGKEEPWKKEPEVEDVEIIFVATTEKEHLEGPFYPEPEIFPEPERFPK